LPLPTAVQAPRDRATVAQLSEFDEIMDVRTPSEFALDHVPGARNLPVLSDEERARVGTLYKQVSPFTARKVGAALVSANIARHLQSELQDKPRAWRPLVYCWRGGQRSAAFTHILREIGWDAKQLEGGYKSFRRAVIADLPELVKPFRWLVICGLTGSGKSRLLTHLEQAGAQVLDLERLAVHRGSLLGNLPDSPQPTQKMFESLVWDKLRRFDARRPVYVESESKRIGVLQVPQALLEGMWSGDCAELTASVATRIALLKADYGHFLREPQLLCGYLEQLVQLHARATVDRWKQMATHGDWDSLVEELLLRHYDPAYTRSIASHYPRFPHAPKLNLASESEAAFTQVARTLLEETAESVA
jgi:tRNA 2-selenouridine synthase